jgi:hypothetical protein
MSGAKLGLNRFEMVASAAAIVTTLLCIEGTLNAAEAYLNSRPISGVIRMLGVLGWAVATFAPIGLAVGFRRLAERASRPWLLHLLFLPSAYALLRAGGGLMLFVIGDPDFDATRGGPVIQASLLFALALVAYYGAASFSGWRRRS